MQIEEEQVEWEGEEWESGKVRWERMRQRGKEAGENELTTKDGRSAREGIGVRRRTEE